MALLNLIFRIFLFLFYQISKRSQSTVWGIISLTGECVSLFFHAQVDITVELPITFSLPPPISPFLARTGPDVIRNLSVTQITTSSVSLNWTEPQGNSSFYRVEWDDNTVPMNKTTSQTSMNITGLNAGAQYVFRVFAVAEDNQTAGDSVSKTLYTSKSTS